MYYFAYGSNMNHHQMLKERCPGSTFIGPALLEEYWLVFDGYSAPWRGAVANIVPSKDDVVWGGLIEIQEDHLKALDAFEGCPQYYSRITVNVKRKGGNDPIGAWTYIREPHPEGTPSHEYLSAMIKGARNCHLPEDYIWSSFEINLKLPPATTRDY